MEEQLTGVEDPVRANAVSVPLLAASTSSAHTHRAKELIHAAAGSFGEETAWRNEGAGVGATV